MSNDSPPSSAVTAPGMASEAPITGPVSLRVYHEAEKPRNGRLVTVSEAGVYPSASPDEEATLGVSGSQMFAALSDTVNLEKFAPHVYCSETDCFVAVQHGPGHFYPAHTHTDGIAPRLDVRLMARNLTSPSPRGDQLMCDSSNTDLRGAWFGIGIVRGKVSSNHGSLWRSALSFGASYTFTVGRRYDKKSEGAADVYKSHRQMPCFGYESVSAFAASAPVDAQWVAVEYGGQSLSHFRHPKRAVYILGSEDAGIPPSLVARAHHHVSIPVALGRPASFNVAAAGAIIMWDRMLKISASSKNTDPDGPSSSQRNSAPGSNMSKRFSAPSASMPDDEFEDGSPVSPGL